MYKNDKFNDRKKKFDGHKDDFSERENQNEKDIIFGRNSVSEAIKAGRPLDSVMVAKGERSGSVPKILADAKNAGVPIKEVDRKKLDFMCGHANHQGVIAVGAVKAYSSVDDIFALAEEKGEPPFIIVCDEIEDPHNLGAIIRTAEAAGAHGVIVPKRRSAPLSFAVSKTSSLSSESVTFNKQAVSSSERSFISNAFFNISRIFSFDGFWFASNKLLIFSSSIKSFPSMKYFSFSSSFI